MPLIRDPNIPLFQKTFHIFEWRDDMFSDPSIDNQIKSTQVD